MVNSTHEAHHRTFREFPGLYRRAFALLGLPDPGPTEAESLNCDLTEIQPVERRVDSLLRQRCADSRTYLLIVESQTKKDPAKARSWGYYLTYLASKHPEAHPMLLVVCRNRHTARWAKGPFRIGHGSQANLHVTPFVLGPEDVPAVKDVDQALEDLELAVLSAVTHIEDARIDDILEILATAMKKAPEEFPTELATELISAGLSGSPSADLWRNLMGALTLDPNSKTWLAEYYRELGRVESRKEDLLNLCAARGIPLSEEDTERITACEDLERLGRWVRKAGTAGTTEEIFAEGTEK
ncbi:hypothetical protein ITI46_19515 [Streptomyces oryzae]|uniref:Transposase (putative) YhgA-like domain-containing protein n=1 Tax=Streptomyces oryzae TaxID=1434886 RepID=A0ABS3XEM3_9ACTN|nr:hypothetical protein [Streptomyces oryzae]MBO8193833.1 hypothetical protein [Streptomyces oryzae]